MRTVTFYDPKTGEISGHVRGGAFEIKTNRPPGHKAIEGRHEAATHRIVDGKPVAKAPPAAKPPAHGDLRHHAYPSWRVLADALYWQAKGDNSKFEAWIRACDDVKAKHPKGDDQ